MLQLKAFSGKIYYASVYDLATPPAYPGVYLVGSQDSTGFRIVYIGEAQDVRARLANHEKRAVFTRYGATVVAVHVTFTDGAGRCAVERDLIAAYDPPGNKETIDLVTLLGRPSSVRRPF